MYAYEIHESIYETLCLRESEVVMIQRDRTKRHVYIKLSDPQLMQELWTSTAGHAEYRHTKGVTSKFRIKAVGLCVRKVGISKFPVEVAERCIRMALRKYGDIRDIQVTP